MKQPRIKIYDHGKPLFSLSIETLLAVYCSTYGIELPDGDYQLRITGKNICPDTYVLRKETK